MNVSEFKSLGTMKAYTSTKGAAGGATPVLAESVDIWMKFEQLGGSTGPNQAQMMSDVTARVTTWYNAAFNANWILYFDGQYYTITFIKVDDPAYRRFMIMDVAVSVSQTSWS